jgi:hypothetical protein
VAAAVAAGATGTVAAALGGAVEAGLAAAGAAVGATAGAVVGAVGETFAPVHAARTLTPAADARSRNATRLLTSGIPSVEWFMAIPPKIGPIVYDRV